MGLRSQQALADALGVAQSTVANWEGGRREPSYETLARLARRLEVSADYLLGLSDDPWGNGGEELRLRSALFGRDLDLPEETLDALVALGYSPVEAAKAVRKVEDAKEMTSEQILKASLRYML